MPYGADYEKVNMYMNKLPGRERFVIEKTFWGNWTQKRIGKHLKIDQSRVSRLLKNGFKHLSQMASKEGYKPQPHYAISSMYSTWNTTFSYSPDLVS
jgi:DNA-directed RNA polymerase specialized sigma24 family protein